jgi:hypothetical protein
VSEFPERVLGFCCAVLLLAFCSSALPLHVRLGRHDVQGVSCEAGAAIVCKPLLQLFARHSASQAIPRQGILGAQSTWPEASRQRTSNSSSSPPQPQ